MIRYIILMLLCSNIYAGPYIKAGLGVPLYPSTGYIPDQYGILGFGYSQHLKGVLSFDLGFSHRSLTRSDLGTCPHHDCNGDNVVEGLFILEWK